MFTAIGDEAGHHQHWRTDGTPEVTVIGEEGTGEDFRLMQGSGVTTGGIEFFVVSEWGRGLDLWKVTK